jgi:hypothetical protein
MKAIGALACIVGNRKLFPTPVLRLRKVRGVMKQRALLCRRKVENEGDGAQEALFS